MTRPEWWCARDNATEVDHQVLQVVEVRVEELVEERAECVVVVFKHHARLVRVVALEPGPHGRVVDVKVVARRVVRAGAGGADVHEDVEERLEVVPRRTCLGAVGVQDAAGDEGVGSLQARA